MKTNLLDTLIILLCSATLAIFLLWASSELLQLVLFKDVPEYLTAVAENVFTIIASGAGLSLLLYVIRRQIIQGKKEFPPYIPYIVGITLIFLFSIVILANVIQWLLHPVPNGEIEGNATKMILSTMDSDRLGNSKTGKKLTVTGPFFTNDTTDSVALYHISDHENGDVVEFYMKNNSVGRISGFRITMLGACRLPNTKKLAFLLSDWPGTPTIPGNLISVSFDNSTGFLHRERIFEVLADVDDVLAKYSIINCSGKQSSWSRLELDGSTAMFYPCDCSYESQLQINKLIRRVDHYMPDWIDDKVRRLGEDLIFEYDSEWDEELAHFQGYRIIADEKFTELLDELERLPRDSGVELVERDSGEMKAVQITYSKSLFSPFQYLFAKHASDNTWEVIYEAPYTSKGRSPARVKRFVEPNVLRMEMCVNNCGYPGMMYGIVDLDLVLGLARLVEHKGLYFDGKPSDD